jgi:hypothetical protein
MSEKDQSGVNSCRPSGYFLPVGGSRPTLVHGLKKIHGIAQIRSLLLVREADIAVPTDPSLMTADSSG